MNEEVITCNYYFDISDGFPG